MVKRRPRFAWLVLGVLSTGLVCWVQGQEAAGKPAARPVLPRSEQIESRADKLDYDRDTGWIRASGHVVIRKGDQILSADYVRVNLKTEHAYAYGRVVLRKGAEVWRAEKAEGNFGTGEWDVMRPTGGAAPFKLDSEKAERLAGNAYVVHNARLTTCTNDMDHAHFHVRARKVEVVPDEFFKARGAKWYFGSVPILYLPYWRRSLNEDLGFTFVPGYNSEMGAFLLSSYAYRMNPLLTGETHLDYRTRRGVGVGQDFRWRQKGRYDGELQLYYLEDQEPYEEGENQDLTDIDSSRYRIRLDHQYDFSSRDYLLMQANYLSDPDVLEDFFEREYRRSRQPENYVTYTHRADNYTIGIDVWTRLNDFYENVNRHPEFSLEFMRQPIADSAFYYDGQNAVAYLEKVWSEESEKEEYAAFRIDSEHMLYRPSRHFGFLNLVPRVGYRGTYYSETVEMETSDEVVLSVTTNQVVAGGVTNLSFASSMQTNSTTMMVGQGSKLRSLFELGGEVSFKAFRMWDRAGQPFRHVVEPRANYTLVPEPNLLPENVYQFDRVDREDQTHEVLLGLRNKVQTKRGAQPYDIVDFDVYTIVDLDPEDDEDALSDFIFDAEFRFAENVRIDADARWNVEEGGLDTFNTQLYVDEPDAWRADVEYRYRRDDSSLLAASVTFFPNKDWTFNLYGRYELEDSELEEQGGFLQRNLDCMVIRTTASIIPGYTRTDGSERDDEWRVGVEFWLTAFPKYVLSG